MRGHLGPEPRRELLRIYDGRDKILLFFFATWLISSLPKMIPESLMVVILFLQSEICYEMHFDLIVGSLKMTDIVYE